VGGGRVLEIAAGSGIATSVLAAYLPHALIEATDVNGDMVAFASCVAAFPNVHCSVADAMSLPFPDRSFDIAVCQFGAMFFPDCVRAMREVRRVLAAGGSFLFNVWDDLANNDVARIVFETAVDTFPDNPPSFLARTPYGHSDTSAIERDLYAAGFAKVRCETVELPSGRVPHQQAAFGLCEGTPMKHEIIERDPRQLEKIVRSATSRLRKTFGGHTVGGKMRAFIFTAG
jgi:ubiquinone/menaquinone biosynthesis C-methylase UbiE